MLSVERRKQRMSRRRFGIAALLILWQGTSRAQEALDSSSDPDPSPVEISGESALDRFYGELDERIPIKVPAYHGIEPELELHYHSSLGNGFVGVGWALHGISQIQRATPGRGAPTWTARDVFLLDGQPLVPCAAGSTSPSCTTGGTHATQIESYARIVFDPVANTWTITANDGTRMLYGPVYAVAQGIFRWGLANLADTHGNTTSYRWWCDHGAD